MLLINEFQKQGSKDRVITYRSVLPAFGVKLRCQSRIFFLPSDQTMAGKCSTCGGAWSL